MDSCTVALFNHLVGASKERQGNVEVEGFGCLLVDDKLVLCRLLHRKVRWLLAPQDAIGIAYGSAALIDARCCVTKWGQIDEKRDRIHPRVDCQAG